MREEFLFSSSDESIIKMNLLPEFGPVVRRLVFQPDPLKLAFGSLSLEDSGGHPGIGSMFRFVSKQRSVGVNNVSKCSVVAVIKAIRRRFMSRWV